MDAIKIIALPLGPFQVFTYILACRKTGDCAIIDPAGDPTAIVAALAREKGTPRMILNTHGHPDHVLANAALKEELDVLVWMHAEDSGLYTDAPGVTELEQQTGLTVDTTADHMFSDEERIVLGEAEIRVLHTPGHTPGSCCFLVDDHLFTGDTLFVGDVGRTDLKGGSLEQLIHSIETKLLDLPDNTCIWPGHDYNIDTSIPRVEAPTTLGKEKQENPYITDFILDP
ncbi:MBL fold metallo-hydrolase [Desulfosarcina widdelii]|uniref:MBL fold metallo-hydrolase n=1 Tax=Desulfosarcina widdelii TaxID=947919 RepID=A0A5K7Z0N7_9BACT|nr:MBL fold metallo-hydrolase [Desulfosarcina widdelii]BBO74255.1 MBL fold metallo-hydrolase [Desulfosarcina widdelii]